MGAGDAAAKAQAAPHGHLTKAKVANGHAAKAKGAPHGHLTKAKVANGHAAKAKAGPHGHATMAKACSHGQGMQPPMGMQQLRQPHGHAAAKAQVAPYGHAAKAKATPHGHATAKAQATPHGHIAKAKAAHGHVAKAKATPHGHVAAKAQATPHGHSAKAKAATHRHVAKANAKAALWVGRQGQGARCEGQGCPPWAKGKQGRRRMARGVRLASEGNGAKRDFYFGGDFFFFWKE